MMNFYDEQRLRDEVVYLHALWHQGPPRNPKPKPSPKPGTRKPSTSLHTPISNTSFKNQNTTTITKNKKKRTRKNENTNSSSESDPVPDLTVNPILSPPAATTGVLQLKPYSDDAIALAMQVQHNVLESSREFLSKIVEQVKSDEGEKSGHEDYLTEDDDIAESEEYKFLLQLFINDDRLRDYFEKNHESGDFCCLVCGGIGEKVKKKFKGCFSLIQHAIAVSKSKRNRAHRAFGQVVCNVLGWDIDRFPSIVSKGEPLGRTLMNSGVTQDASVVKDNEGSNSRNNGEIVEKEVLGVSENNVELMVCENTLKINDASKFVENSDSELLNMETGKEGAMDCQGSSPSLVDGIEWPCTKPVDESPSKASGWPSPKPWVIPLVPQLAPEEQVRLAAVQLQRKVLEACREFFEKRAGSDIDEEDEDDLMDEDGPKDNEEFKFLLKVFTENSGLRSYYEKNYEGGEFYCLVCGGLGKKVWKRYKDCIGLVQHATAISKTKKKRAHRAFGQVICKVLGWDIDRFPMIVLKGETLSHCLTKSDMSQGEVDAIADGGKDSLIAQEKNVDCELARKEDSDLDPDNGIFIISQSYSKEENTNKPVNNVCGAILDVEGDKDGATAVLA